MSAFQVKENMMLGCRTNVFIDILHEVCLALFVTFNNYASFAIKLYIKIVFVSFISISN